MMAIKKKTVKKSVVKKVTAKKSPFKKIPTKKEAIKKAPAKKSPAKKAPLKKTPSKKMQERGTDIRLLDKKRYSVNIYPTSEIMLGVGKTLVNNDKVKNIRDLIIKNNIAPMPSENRKNESENKKSDNNNFYDFNANKQEENIRSEFKLKSNGKYNVGKIKGLKIVNKDGYAPLKVLVIKFDKDEINLLKNGLPIKFILEK